MASIIEEYKFCLRDVKIYNDYIVFNDNFFKVKLEQYKRKHLIHYEIKGISEILSNNYYILPPVPLYTNNYIMTGLGNVARNLNEIHTLFASKVRFIEHLSIKEIAGIFSCFTNIRVDNKRKQLSISIDVSETMKYALPQLRRLTTKFPIEDDAPPVPSAA